MLKALMELTLLVKDMGELRTKMVDKLEIIAKKLAAMEETKPCNT